MAFITSSWREHVLVGHVLSLGRGAHLRSLVPLPKRQFSRSHIGRYSLASTADRSAAAIFSPLRCMSSISRGTHEENISNDEHVLDRLLSLRKFEEVMRIADMQKKAYASDNLIPQSADYYRAQVFLLRDNDVLHARQALLEYLRLARPITASGTKKNANSASFEDQLFQQQQYRHAKQLLHEINEVARPFLMPLKELEKEYPLFYMLADALLDHTMLTWTRLFGLYLHATRVLGGAEHASESFAVGGDFVECGTAGGGSAVMLAVLLAHFDKPAPHRNQRKLFCCDTFTGMPTPIDACDFVSSPNVSSQQRVKASSNDWGQGTCAAPVDHVQRLARQFSVEDRIRFFPGLFDDTLPDVSQCVADSGVALLHCDADWYASTKSVLGHLWPRVPKGGVMQVDDYHYWSGCRQAVSEYRTPSGARLPSPVDVDGNAVYFEKS